MKVLQVHARYSQPGGEDACVDAEAELLRAEGHQVMRIETSNADVAGGFDAARTLLSAPWNEGQRRRAKRTAEEWRPDVAHVHNTWPSISPAVIDGLHRAGVPVVMTVHNYRMFCANALLFRDGHRCTDCLGRSPLPGLRHRCFRNSLAGSAAACATISVQRRTGVRSKVRSFIAPTGVARDILLRGGIPAESIEVVPHAIADADAGARAQAPSRSNVVLFTGRLSEEKGVAQLLDGWRGFAERRGELELWIAGDGPLREELESGAPDGVRFLGWLERKEIVAVLHSARAVMFPSLCYETFGLGVAEAFCAGTPVIATGGGAAGELVEASGGGVTVAAEGGGEPWRGGLPQLLDEDWVDRAGEAGRRYFEAALSPGRVGPRLQEVYRAAMINRHA